jgi:hypothetical protein
MPSTPLRRALKAALNRRANVALGPDAQAIDFVECWVEAGLSMTALARAVSIDLSRCISRGFVSFVCQRLAPDARARLASARRVARDFSVATRMVATIEPAPDGGENHRA